MPRPRPDTAHRLGDTERLVGRRRQMSPLSCGSRSTNLPLDRASGLAFLRGRSGPHLSTLNSMKVHVSRCPALTSPTSALLTLPTWRVTPSRGLFFKRLSASQDSGNTHVGILVAGYDGGWPGLPPDRPIDRMARLNELPAPRVPGRPRFITCSFPVVSGSPIPQRHATSEKADPVRVDGYWARCRARNANDGGSCDKKNGSVWQP